jgi:hypothetical protein
MEVYVSLSNGSVVSISCDRVERINGYLILWRSWDAAAEFAPGVWLYYVRSRESR